MVKFEEWVSPKQDYEEYIRELKEMYKYIIQLEENIKKLDLIVSLDILKQNIDNYNFNDGTINIYVEEFEKQYNKIRDKNFFDTMRLLIKGHRELKNMYYRDIVNVVVVKKKTKEEIERERKEEEEKEKKRVKKGVALDI